MSDSENDDRFKEVRILNEEEEDEFDSEDNFLVQDIKNNILEKNQFNTEKEDDPIMSEIIIIHRNYGFNDEELIAEVRKCVINKIIDISLIKTISEFASKTHPNEKMYILKLIYEFISDPEFDENQNDKIRKYIPIILKKFEKIRKDKSFRDIFIKIKIEIILYIFDINDEYIQHIIAKCVEKNWNLTAIKTFQIKLKYLIPEDEKIIQDEELLEKKRIENEEKRHIIESLLNTISAFPMDNVMFNMENIDFTNRETIARDFYLKCSTTSDCPKKELDVDELLTELENLNLNTFSKQKIAQFRHQIIKAKTTIKPKNYNNWMEHFKAYDFKSKDKNEYIAEALGVISHALEEKKKFPLRAAQLLAIFIFIDNNESQEDDDMNIENDDEDEEPRNNEIILIEDENKNRNKKKKIKKDNGKGIIEQISTGEGKSAIISCLSAFYGLRNRKVDIITSSRTLAVRDSSEFKEFYKIFNLEVDFVKDYQQGPYKADIIYGTFLDLEGDLLEEISSNKEIRGDRPYDIVIIDEVDNAFIDCITGSTQLTHSSKGYQFLIPMYVSIYLFVDLLDNMYLEASLKKYYEIIAQEEYKNLDENSKKNILEQISNNYERKDAFLDYIEKFFDDMKQDISSKDPKSAEELKNVGNGEIKTLFNIWEDAAQSPDSMKKYLQIPQFLKDFVQAQMNLWTNNAFCAKNLYKRETDYTISTKSHDGYASITPIDRKNTGELEFNTVYRNGLHQMLQIKENLRVKSETLTHTFLSHISYFIKYKKKNFFGLTGTIGGDETHIIYKGDSFNSNLVFIPSYMAKRFIELPAIICKENFDIHINKICEEIFFHFMKGRKILVICKDINEGINIDNNLHKDTFVKKDPTINSNIFLYVRNDIDDLEEELSRTPKRIIISTNLGGRGTDIKTTVSQEKNGGLHVIITKLSSNSRTQKQAFGRTSRQGNKGSGQFIITEKKNLKTYDQLIKERDRKEKEMIEKIDLDELLLKDELFQEYVECLKKYPELNTFKGSNTKDEIDERWSFFLKKNFNDGKKQYDKIRKNFKIFKSEIDKIMSLPRYLRFNNDFLRITDAFNHDDNEDISYEELFKYLVFENCDKCFYFAASYLKALVEWSRYEKRFLEDYNDSQYCIKIIQHLFLAKKQIKELISLNIEPTLKSVEEFNKLSNTKYFGDIKNYRDTEFYKQFETRKKILNNLIEHCDKNIRTTQEYMRDYLPQNSIINQVVLWKENKPMKDCLMLQEEDKKDLGYLYDAGFEFTYELSIRKPVLRKSGKYYLTTLGFFISFILAFFSTSLSLKFSTYLSNKLDQYSRTEFVDVHEEQSLFTKIKNAISSMFQSRENENQNENNNANANQHELQNDNNDENNNNENKNDQDEKNDKKNSPDDISKINFIELKEKTLKEMKKRIIEMFNKKIKEMIDEIKFLVFIDYFFKEEKNEKDETWKDIIIKITLNSFNTREMLLRKGEIIRMFNKKSEQGKAIEELTKEAEKAIDKIIHEIKTEFEKEELEQNKVKSLEHIIIKKRLGDIDYKTSIEIVRQILSQNILNNKGKFTKDIFKIKPNKKNKEKIKEEEKKKRIQFVKIFYNCPYPKEIKAIKNIEDFSLTQDFELKFDHDLILQDVNMLYLLRNYKDPDKRVFSDFTYGIKDIIIEVFNKSTDDITDKFESFVHAICQKVYEKIKSYLELEIFPNILINKTKIKKKKLNPEEQKIVNLINDSSKEKTFDLMKLKSFENFFKA